MKRFALIGVGGYIAPRHLEAIKATGNNLVAAMDIHDNAGILDSYFPDCDFFTEIERFDRHLDKLRRNGQGIDYLVVCTPNYLHDAHIRLGIRNGAHVICEKPVVINPWNLDALEKIQEETGKQLYGILQLRYHSEVIALKNEIFYSESKKKYKVNLKYFTPRGNWYMYSWKGNVEKSGGLAGNIGIHLWDMLIWLYGQVEKIDLIIKNSQNISGVFFMEKAEVHWELSIDKSNSPNRFLDCDGKQVLFNSGFSDLHTICYQEILAGRGFGINTLRPSIELLHRINRILF